MYGKIKGIPSKVGLVLYSEGSQHANMYGKLKEFPTK